MEIKKYFKFDEKNQYLENEDDINYFAVNQARHVAQGNMLGDFDENGYYVIDENIVKQLVAMPKVIVDSIEEIDLIRSSIKFDNYIHFMLVAEDDKAKLVLLEKINFESNIKYNVGRYSNMNEYVLDEIIIPDKDYDKNIIYNKFNIKRVDDGKFYDFMSLTEEELLQYSAIIAKLKYNCLAQSTLLENEKQIEVIEADYFDNILNVFDGHEKEKNDFIEFLKAIVLEKKEFVEINKPFFQKTMNEILDNALAIFLDKLSPELRLEIEQKIRKEKKKYFSAFDVLFHLQFLANENALTEEDEDSIINGIMETKRNKLNKILRLAVNGNKMLEVYYKLLEERNKLQALLEDENADKEMLLADNPTLKKFFGDINKQTGKDILKPEAKDAKQPETKKLEVKVEAKKDDKKPEVKKPEAKKDDKKSEVKKPEVKKPEVKKDDKKQDAKKTENKITPSNSVVEPPKKLINVANQNNIRNNGITYNRHRIRSSSKNSSNADNVNVGANSILTTQESGATKN